MALFGLFSGKDSSEEKEQKVIPWNVLNSLDQLDAIAKESESIPVAIFKHSTRCGISRMVIRQFESSYSIDPNQLKLYYLDLLSYRDVSNEVGYRFQVIHQSPQLIVIKNGNAVAHASHHGISANSLQNYI
ncbi:MAG: bacillithiol system redox-active protein YtxJ [Flavobacteriaceae bacterium]|nr:bacillithiol system redox-active protein YtxJ [Flavobacteriaceae bacterium]